MLATAPIHGDRVTFPSPKNSQSANLYQIAGEILEYCHNWEDTICVKQSGDGFTFYVGGDKKGNSFVGLQPGRLLVDPSVRKRVAQSSPTIIDEGIEDGWLAEIEGDNFGNSFRAQAPLGPTLTPPQVEATRTSLRMIQQNRSIQR